MSTRAVIAILLAACSAQSKAPEPTPPTSPAPEPSPTPAPTKPKLPSNAQSVTLAEVGLEPASLDRTADPCVDFYQFACGGWLQANQIPPDRARWARFSEIEEKNKAAIRSLLEDDAKGIGVDPVGKKLGDFYASCMDTATIEKNGLAAIKPTLDKTTKVRDAKSWQTAVTELHKVGVDVVWNIGTGADFHDSTVNLTQIDSGGLGLPDRDYYLKPELKDKLDAYRAHVARTLVLAGTPAAKSEAAAADVLAIETELAKVTKTAVDKRDPQKAYNEFDEKKLAAKVKSFDWKAYWKALNFTPSTKIIVGTPDFLGAIDGLRTKFKPAQWSSYFTYHLLHESAFLLPKTYDDEAFELKKAITGQPQQAERYKRCIDETEQSLGELLGQQYVAKYFPAQAKQTATALVNAVVTSLGEDLRTLDWMSDTTKKIAEQKRAKIVNRVGYPDKWRTYDFEVKRDEFTTNALRANAFEVHRQLAKSGKPVDRGEWLFNVYVVNAYYDPTQNNTAILAGILQQPFFAQDRGIAENYGGIGMVIGHELTHGFDDQGAQFDAEGNLKDWWTPEDKTKFEAKTKCVADQYSTFEALPKQFVNGKLTLGEDIADLGGVKLAFRAYREQRKDAPKQYVADGFTEDQQFFLAVGQAWCSKDRAEETQRRLTIDPHAPPKFRVYGALRNLPEFAQAFSCSAGTPMAPANRCLVW